MECILKHRVAARRYVENQKLKLKSEKRLKAFKARLEKFGLTYEQWLELYTAQDGKCCICTVSKQLVLDHDHATGKFRGLICWSCNVGLGAFKDTVTALRRAAKYVEDARAANQFDQATF